MEYHDRLSIPDDEPLATHEPCEWEDTAIANGQELTAIRRDIQDFIAWLRDPVRGPIVFRAEVVDRLKEILAR